MNNPGELVAKLESGVKLAAGNPKVRRIVVSLLAACFVLQLYFVRELIAAELLFGLVFIFWLALAGTFYVVGILAEHGLEWGQHALRFMNQTARRGYVFAGEIAKKSLRHPESAQ